MTPTIYLAAAWPRRIEVSEYAAELRRAGVTITSTWHDHDDPDYDALTHADLARIAARDRDDLEDAGALCLFNGPPGTYQGRGGAFCEYGYALALGLRLVVVSHRSSVYEYLPEVTFCPDPVSAITYLRSLRLDGRGRAA